MDQLRLLWILILCLVFISGHTATDPLTKVQLKSTPVRAFYVAMEITNRIFNTTLTNPETDEYKATYEEVSNLLNSIYGCNNHTKCPTNKFYGGVVAMTFSSGSVIANATIIFHTSSINPSVASSLFHQNANNMEPQILQINPNFTTIEKVTETTASKTTTTAMSSTTDDRTTTRPITITTIKTTTPISATSPTTTTPAKATITLTTATRTPMSTTVSTVVSSSIPSTSSNGGQNTTQNPTMNNTTTLNPHSKHTDSQNTSHGKPSDSPTGGGSNGGGPNSVPGWGIALLVLAAAILLLLIIIFMIMLVQWCGKKTESEHMDTFEDPYYFEKKQHSQQPLSVQSSQPPVTQKPVSTAVIVGDTPRKNRTGFYAVNP
ncbi:putative GPI-anchored protein pfl2 [Mugil cephalus]|uniref:putative GPI-anchored protein pfl2 n=1 Tax=Mugil cephalus TaxID=48193 RepID=UPI001FB84E18|nr:putative GPI-anchored protein pfl2 [Mugil cephalus]